MSSASVDVTTKLTMAPDELVASTVIFAGTVKVGAVFGYVGPYALLFPPVP